MCVPLLFVKIKFTGVTVRDAFKLLVIGQRFKCLFALFVYLHFSRIRSIIYLFGLNIIFLIFFLDFCK